MSVSQAGTLGRELLVEAIDPPPPRAALGHSPPMASHPRAPPSSFSRVESPHGTLDATVEAEKGARGAREHLGAEGAENGGANLHAQCTA